MPLKKILLLFFVFICQNVFSQETFFTNGTQDKRHTVYALTNAKLYVDYKTVIDSATLLVKDKIIVDAGRGITVPPDAVIIDCKGMCIYPSFIDLYSSYGLPDIQQPKRGDRTPQLESNKKGAYNWNESIRCEYNAYENFVQSGDKADDLRKLGFGIVLSINKDGVMRGTAALVSLADESSNETILNSQAASALSFNKGTSTQDYPESLMGTIALLRQTFYDARWYKTGGDKDEFNITLDALNKQLSLPMVFDAGDKYNILRAQKVAKEFGLSFIVKSGGDDYQRIGEIKNSGAALILPVNYPDAYDVSDAYDAMNISLSQMKEWEYAPGNAASVAKAGIPFCFTIDGLKNKNDFLKNIRKAIQFGLSEADALKALTYTPASLMKFENKTGSLRKGMLANFFISSKNIFEKDASIIESWNLGNRSQYKNWQAKDLRGIYSLNIGSDIKTKMQISGDAFRQEITVMDDTLKATGNMNRTSNLINISYPVKKLKGTIKLSGTSIGDDIKGEAFMPDGSWQSFIATKASADTVTAKRDTAKIDTVILPPLIYPLTGFGRTNLPSTKNVLLKNATVWTNESEGILANADVLISDGKIKAVGKNLAAEGAEIIPADNLYITSGIIDEHSHIAAAGSVNEGTQSSSAEVRIADIIDADDVSIYRQLAGGVTCAHILHGSANAIGGQTQLIKLRWGKNPEEMKFANWPGFIKFALGENVKQSNWGDLKNFRYPQTRMGVEQIYMDHFTRAHEYGNKWKKYNSTKSKTGTPPRYDLEMEALNEILESKRFITCHSYVQSEINMLMHVADSFGFKVNTFTHILEGYKVADKMKAHGVRGVSSFSDWWAYKMEVMEAIPYNGAIMNKMGLTVAFNSDDAEMARRLNQEAAKAVMYGGVSEEEAWKFVTLNPAKMLRVDDRVGSLKPGKDADVVVWNGNPLSVYSKPLYVFIDGIKYFDFTEDQKMQEANNAERARLIAKMADAKAKGEVTQKVVMPLYEEKHCEEKEIHTTR